MAGVAGLGSACAGLEAIVDKSMHARITPMVNAVCGPFEHCRLPGSGLRCTTASTRARCPLQHSWPKRRRCTSSAWQRRSERSR